MGDDERADFRARYRANRTRDRKLGPLDYGGADDEPMMVYHNRRIQREPFAGSMDGSLGNYQKTDGARGMGWMIFLGVSTLFMVFFVLGVVAVRWTTDA